MREEEALEAMVAAWNTGVDEFVGRLAPDVELHAPPGFPDGDVWQGRDAVASLLHDMFGSVFKDVTYKVEDTTHGPGGWLLRARESVTQERGMKLEWEEFLVVQFEGDVVRRLWVFYELGAAQRQAGLDG
jgi:SnoaL-like protein